MHPTVTFHAKNGISSHSSSTYRARKLKSFHCYNSLPRTKILHFFHINFQTFFLYSFFLYAYLIPTSSLLSPISTKLSAYKSSFTSSNRTCVVTSSITTTNKEGKELIPGRFLILLLNLFDHSPSVFTDSLINFFYLFNGKNFSFHHTFPSRSQPNHHMGYNETLYHIQFCFGPFKLFLLLLQKKIFINGLSSKHKPHLHFI